MSGVTFIYVVHIDHNTLTDHGWRPDLLGGSGPVVDVCHFDGGRSRISVSILLGACHRCFLALMMGALRSPSASPRGSTVDVFLR
jgi:hypothetical protein